jgi:hypothetical protein
LGWFPTLQQALSAIPAAEPVTRKRSFSVTNQPARIA